MQNSKVGMKMRENKLKRINQFTALIAVTVLILSFVWSVQRYCSLDFSSYNNEIRLELNEQRCEIEQGIYSKSKYEYIVFDLDGRVLYADKSWKYHVGDNVIVEEMLQQDKSFLKEHPGFSKSRFVLSDEGGSCIGFVVYLIPETVLNDNIYSRNLLLCFFPVGIGILICCIYLIAQTIYVNQRILKPLQQISTSAQAIIVGNYDMEVQRVYGENLKENEVGELTYSFELMRDELKAKQMSEQSLRKAQQELMSCISHDLRTPISTIKAYSEGLRDGVIMEDMEQGDYLEIILQKTNLLEKMISDLLAYSNTQLNKMEIIPKEIYQRYLSTYFTADIEAAWKAVFIMCDLFAEIAKKVAADLEYYYNNEEAEMARKYLYDVSRLSKDADKLY